MSRELTIKIPSEELLCKHLVVCTKRAFQNISVIFFDINLSKATLKGFSKLKTLFITGVGFIQC